MPVSSAWAPRGEGISAAAGSTGGVERARGWQTRTAATLSIRTTACSESVLGRGVEHHAVPVDREHPAAEPLALDEDLDRRARCRGHGSAPSRSCRSWSRCSSWCGPPTGRLAEHAPGPPVRAMRPASRPGPSAVNDIEVKSRLRRVRSPRRRHVDVHVVAVLEDRRGPRGRCPGRSRASPARSGARRSRSACRR